MVCGAYGTGGEHVTEIWGMIPITNSFERNCKCHQIHVAMRCKFWHSDLYSILVQLLFTYGYKMMFSNTLIYCAIVWKTKWSPYIDIL